jgi:hypothetical protein
VIKALLPRSVFRLLGACLWLCVLALPVRSGLAASDGEIGLSVGSPTAVSTFECIGVVLPFTGDDNQNSKCEIEFRREGEAFQKGLDLFVDHRTNWSMPRGFRGSIVHLQPGAAYEIKLTYTDPDGGSGSVSLTAKTWSNEFPEKKVVAITPGREKLMLSEGGSREEGYVVYDGQGQTFDGSDLDDGLLISANYVILRNLKIVGPKKNGIVLAPNVHDVVIEDCDISEMGLEGENPPMSCGILAQEGTERIVIQHCSIHHPRGNAKTWEFGHPLGFEGISFIQSKGNHVLRYNRFYSSEGHYIKDVLGGANDGDSGSLRSDSDVYGNLVSGTRDDGLEVEGFNINVRIWGNVISGVFKAISTASIGYSRSHKTDSSLGPQYIFRNVFIDAASSATKIRGDGGYYFLHNTVMEAVPLALEAPDPSRSPEIKWHGLVLNNIIGSPKPQRYRNVSDGDEWTFDSNLYAAERDAVLIVDGWEKHGIFGVKPEFEKIGDFTWYLKEGSRGIGEGQPIPNFSFGSEHPDMGACERGVYFMRVGPHADKWEAAK